MKESDALTKHPQPSCTHIWLLVKLPFIIILPAMLAACAPGTGILGGGNWQISALQHQPVRVLTVDAKDPQKIYAGSAQGNIFVSTDAGQHWTERSTGLPLPAPIHVLSTDDSGKKIYSATGKGLFVSADAAAHWNLVSTQAGLPADSYTALLFDPDAPNTIYAGTAHQGLFVSSDGGNTWTTLGSGLARESAIYDLSLDPVQHQLWAATSAGIYRSDDKGASWRPFNNGLPPGVVVNVVQPASAGGGARGLIYAGVGDGFFRSQDSGAHWARGQMALSGVNVHSILVDFRAANTTTVYVGTGAGALRSDDNGQNWSTIATGLPQNAPIYALALGASNYAQLYAATGSEVYMFPGTSSATDANRFVPFILILFFFYLLFRFTTRTRGARRNPAQKTTQAGASPPGENSPHSGTRDG